MLERRSICMVMVVVAILSLISALRPLVTLASVGAHPLQARIQLEGALHETWLIGVLITERDIRHATRFLESLDGALESVQGEVAVDLMLVSRHSASGVFEGYADHISDTSRIRKLINMTVDYEEFKHGGGVEIQRTFVLLRNKMLDYATQNRYNGFMSLDSDVLLRKSTLRMMLDTRQPVVTALYTPRWSRSDVSSAILQPAMSNSLVDMGKVLAACNYEACDAFCTYCNGTVNLHLKRTLGLAVEAATVTGGCTLVRNQAMHSRLAFGRMDCEVKLPGLAPHMFYYHGDDFGWGLNLIKDGFQPYVLAGHLLEHLAGADTPTGLLPSQREWPIDLSQMTLSARLN